MPAACRESSACFSVALIYLSRTSWSCQSAPFPINTGDNKTSFSFNFRSLAFREESIGDIVSINGIKERRLEAKVRYRDELDTKWMQHDASDRRKMTRPHQSVHRTVIESGDSIGCVSWEQASQDRFSDGCTVQDCH
jgi:hypothetical protein